MSRPTWTADDIGRSADAPETVPVQYHPAEAATELGAEQQPGDGIDPARGIVTAILATGACLVLALLLSAWWGAV